MSKRNPNTISVTDIASLGICEQQTILDHKHGKARSKKLQHLAKGGIREHAAYDKQVSSISDPRCFIVSAVFGACAPETHLLRAFRDKHLMPYWWGRHFCCCYYRLSPKLTPLLMSNPHLLAAIRFLLRIITNVIKPKRRSQFND